MRILYLAAMVLLVGTALHAQEPTNVATRVDSENNVLRGLYEEGPEVLDQAVFARLEKLNGSLERLSALNRDIQAAGRASPYLREQALEGRAAAWLHAWALFSRVAIHVSRTNRDEVRTKLLELASDDSPSRSTSALALLLRIYKQMREAEASGIRAGDPLNARLGGNPAIVGLLSSRWPRGKVGGDHRPSLFIPNARFLAGTLKQEPITDHELLSLGAVVNLQLDSWHRTASDRLSGPRGSRADGTHSLGLVPLASWLVSLAANKDLEALKEALSSQQFSDKLRKLAAFLRFREKYASGIQLEKLLNRLAKRRIPPIADSKDEYDDLVEAARPLGSERLFDALIWLRYVLLLSYRTERSAVLDESDPACLAAVWEGLRVDAPLTWERKRPADGKHAFLRWDRSPDDGHFSAVLADVTVVGREFLKFDRTALNLEGQRFVAAGTAERRAGSAYADALDRARTPLREALESQLAPYFERSDGSPAQWTDPMSLSRSTGDLARSFRTTATEPEQERLATDLAALAGKCQTALRLYELMGRAYRSPDPDDVNTALRLAGGMNGISTWNIHGLPNKPFKVYHDALAKKIAHLKEEISKVDTARVLREAFKDKQLRLEMAQEELAAAQLGRKIAARTIHLNKVYQQIADLETEIEELGVRIAKLERRAWQTQQQAAAVRLAYATRMRDLVAARVVALGVAIKEAKTLAEQAGTELDNLAASFQRAAEGIEKQQERERAFGIVKAIVTVVGAALAPFTGSASLAVAALVNTGIDIYKRIDETDWNNFGSAVQSIGAIAEQAGGAAQLGLQRFGGSKGKELLGKAQSFLKDANAKLKDVQNEVQPILAAIKALKSAEGNRFASALANGFPLSSLDGLSFNVEFGNRKVLLPPGVQEPLKAILDSGCHILNDSEARGRELIKLPELDDAELRPRLKDALKGVVRELPPDFREKLALTEAGSQKPVDSLAAGLVAAIDTLKEDERRLVASALATGLLFARDGNTVFALSRPLDKEARQLQGRLNAVAKKEFAEAIKSAEKQFEEVRAKLQAQGQRLIEKQNSGDLKAIAASIRGDIDRLKNDVIGKIRDHLDAAQAELENREDLKQIATHEAEATTLFAEASTIREEQVERQARRAKLGQEAARQAIEISQMGDEKAANHLKAAVLALELAETDLRLAYQACLDRGINPRVEVSGPASSRGARLTALLAGDRNDGRESVVIDRMAGDIVGMIQWVHVLRLPSDRQGGKGPVRLYLQVLHALRSPQSAIAIAEALKAIATELDDLYAEEALKRISIQPATAEISHDRITWLDDLGEAERARTEGLFREPPRGSLLGAFRFRLTRYRPSADFYHEFAAYQVSTSGENYDHYIDMSEIYLVSESKDLAFLVLPPLTSSQHPAWAGDQEGSVLARDRQPILNSDFDHITADKILEKHSLWKDRLELTEGLGDWTVFIFAEGLASSPLPSGATPAAVSRELRAANFKVKVKMFYLKVRRATAYVP